jgi:hypothetical protein
MKDILSNGATFLLSPLSPELRECNLISHKDHSNHQPATYHHKILDGIILEDIECGFNLPLPPIYCLRSQMHP